MSVQGKKGDFDGDAQFLMGLTDYKNTIINELKVVPNADLCPVCSVFHIVLSVLLINTNNLY